jgi:anaerobic magnesium-protoporphyrin IX monomethyl ester cyclase
MEWFEKRWRWQPVLGCGEFEAMAGVQVGLLWVVPSDEDYQSRRITTRRHLGCAYLSAFLGSKGIGSQQYLFEHATAEEIAAQLVQDGIKVLGLSIKDTNYYAARWIAAAIKCIAPRTVVVVGGLTATFSDELVLNHCDAIDCCVRGYGEDALFDVVRSVLTDGWFDDLGDVSYRVGTTFIRNAAARRLKSADLDIYPSPYLARVLAPGAARDVGISTSRGCVFRCSFCNPTAMAGFTIAYHSDERVIAELRLIHSHLIEDHAESTILFLNEDIFALNLSRTKRLCDRIAAEGFSKITFGCETRIEHLTDDVLASMYRAGFRFLKFGLESGNVRVLNRIKKVRTGDGAPDDYAAERAFLRDVERVVTKARRMGIRVIAGAIFGLPGERLADAIDTLDFIRRIDVDEYYHNFLHLFPGTEIYRRSAEYGYRVELNEGFYPTIYRTYWPYPVELVPVLTDKLDRAVRRTVVNL